jgi:transcription antitermination factor NusA-like protein
MEVPEIHSGIVEIRAIAREAGIRSKVAVASRQEGLDPVGATVGQRGARVQSVVAELGGEKIDVIPWNDDPSAFVANALSPAQVLSVEIDTEHRIANVTVPERMLSLAIGREGQNARLAARLTGWRIDIRSDVSVAEAKAAANVETPAAEEAESGNAGGAAAEVAPAAAPKRARTSKAKAAAETTAATDDVAAAEAAPKPARTVKPKVTKPKAAKAVKAVEAVEEVEADIAVAEGDAPVKAEAKPRTRKTKAAAGEVAS